MGCCTREWITVTRYFCRNETHCEKDSACPVHESQLTELLLKRLERKEDADRLEIWNFNPTYLMQWDLLQVIRFIPLYLNSLSLKVYLYT